MRRRKAPLAKKKKKKKLAPFAQTTGTTLRSAVQCSAKNNACTQQNTEIKNKGEEEEEEEERFIVPCSPSVLRFRPLVPASISSVLREGGPIRAS
jgi:hypothetical protein